MPVLIAIIGILVGGVIWYNRIKAAGEAAGELKDMANDVRLAARRFGFKRRSNVHPIDAIDDARLAASGIVAATAQMDGLWDQSMWDAMVQQCQSVFGSALDEAEEIVTFSRWIADQGKNLHETVRRLSKRLKALAGPAGVDDTVAMICAVSGRAGNGKSRNADDSIDTVVRVLKTP
jgi:hypothetical protein